MLNVYEKRGDGRVATMDTDLVGTKDDTASLDTATLGIIDHAPKPVNLAALEGISGEGWALFDGTVSVGVALLDYAESPALAGLTADLKTALEVAGAVHLRHHAAQRFRQKMRAYLTKAVTSKTSKSAKSRLLSFMPPPIWVNNVPQVI